MKAKSIVLKGANVEAAQADREILGRYLSNYELLEFPKDEKSYSLANDEDFFNMEVTLFGVHYQLEVFPYEMRTDDYQSAINGKVVEGGIGPCRTFRGNVKDTDQIVRLTITEEGMSGFIQLEGQKLFVRKAAL